jgi:hypothetical protein
MKGETNNALVLGGIALFLLVFNAAMFSYLGSAACKVDPVSYVDNPDFGGGLKTVFSSKAASSAPLHNNCPFTGVVLTVVDIFVIIVGGKAVIENVI